jgi:cysteine-rich repeat protein
VFRASVSRQLAWQESKLVSVLTHRVLLGALVWTSACNSANDKAGQPELDAGHGEELAPLFRRPLCSTCASDNCSTLQGLEKTQCMRECNLSCVNECALCKGRCRTGKQAELGTCLSACVAASVCSARPAQCGNGHLEGAEQCDDANTRPGDGCSAKCEIEPCVCGDRVLCRDGSEACDDGNTQDGDGCSASCKCAETADCGVARF